MDIVPSGDVRVLRVASGGRSPLRHLHKGVEVEARVLRRLQQRVHVGEERLAGVVALQGPFGLRQRVLLREPQVQEREHAEASHPGAPLDLRYAASEYGRVASEPVDHESLQQRPHVVGDQPPGAVQRGEYAAPLDVPDEYRWDAELPHEAGVRKIPGHQVELRGRSGPLADDEAVLRGQSRIGFRYLPPRHVAVELHAVPDVHVRPPAEDCLEPAVAGGLQQDGVHVGFGLDAAGPCLEGLPYPDLPSVHRGVRVQREVGRLERRGVHPPLREISAQHGAGDRLAGIRGCAQDEDPHRSAPSSFIRKPMSMFSSHTSASFSMFSSRTSS